MTPFPELRTVTHPAYTRAKQLAEIKAKADAGRLPKI